METYKEHFNQRVSEGKQVERRDKNGNVVGYQTYDTEWDFQNEHLEKRYSDFKDQRDSDLGVQRVDGSPKKNYQAIN